MQRNKFNSKGQKQRIVALSNEGIANELAWRFARQNPHIPFEDFQAEAKVALCACVDVWSADKGKFSTLAWNGIRNELIILAEQGTKHVPAEANDVPTNETNPARLSEFKDTLSRLSKEAQEVVSIIFNGPSELLDIAEDASPCKIRVGLRKHLTKKGISPNYISTIFKEIADIIN